MSHWLFDLGNTRLKCAPLRPDGSVGEVEGAEVGFLHRSGAAALTATDTQRVRPASADCR